MPPHRAASHRTHNHQRNLDQKLRCGHLAHSPSPIIACVTCSSILWLADRGRIKDRKSKALFARSLRPRAAQRRPRRKRRKATTTTKGVGGGYPDLTASVPYSLSQGAETYAEKLVPLLVHPALQHRSGALFNRHAQPIEPNPWLVADDHCARVVEAAYALSARILGQAKPRTVARPNLQFEPAAGLVNCISTERMAAAASALR